MRVSLFYFTFLFGTVQLLMAHSGTSQGLADLTISMESQQESLKSVLKKIEKKAGLSFVIPLDEVETYNDISLSHASRSVKETLDLILSNTDLSYRQINDKTVLIYVVRKKKRKLSENDIEKINFSTETREQIAQAVSGKVSDEKGEPLPGVSVVIKGTQRGTVTAPDGKFELSVDDGSAVLIFSFVGYISQEITVGNQTSVNLSLKADIKALSEVVVVGYGTQKKTSVTAAVTTMKGEEIAAVPVANMSNSLGGRMSGLIVRQNTGEPGRDVSNIFIRGVATTGNTQPLLVVDGIPREFQNLDPNTIESITILKDAAAVAPYGVAGANGVILITTKRGKTGVPTIRYNGYIGFQNSTILPKLPSAFEYAKLKNEASISVGGGPVYSEASLQKFKDGSDPDGHPNQNIYDMLFDKNTALTSHNVELSGGVEKIRYYASVGYQHQAGMWSPTYQNRFNYSMNLDANVSKTTKVSFNINGREQVNNAPTVATDRIFELVHYASPITPILFSNGESGAYVWNNVHNSGSSRTNTSQIYSQLSMEQELPFIKGLRFKGTFAFDPT